jgi:uncharacterized protein YcfL
MKMVTKSGLALLLCINLLALYGCASTTSGMVATGKPGGDPKYAKHLVINNDPLAEAIIIEQMNTRMTGGVLEVSLSLANLTSRDISAQYRFSWYDDANFEVEQGSRAWTPVILHGKSSTSMQARAPNPTVTTYKVNVREL